MCHSARREVPAKGTSRNSRFLVIAPGDERAQRPGRGDRFAGAQANVAWRAGNFCLGTSHYQD